MGTLSHPTDPSGLSNGNVFVIQIPNLTNRRHTGSQDPPHFTGLQTHLHIVSVTAHNLSRASGTSNQLPTLTELQFDIVDSRPQRHARKRQGIARPDFGLGPRLHLIVDRQSNRSEDIPLLPVFVLQQRNAG